MKYEAIKPQFEQAAGFAPTALQVSDAELLSQLPASANFSDVGTGKTVISTLTSLLREVDVTLVVVPPILIPQWTTWLQQVGQGPVCRFDGPPAKRAKLKPQEARWVVMSHAIYRDNPSNWLKLGMGRELELIVDEAHALKSTRSVLFKSVLRQPKVALQLLTATPTSGPIDAYSYIRLKTPNVYKSLGEFELRHIETRDIFQKPTAWRSLDTVAKHLAVHTVKRTKEEVFGYDLTPIFQTMNYDLDASHQKLYKKLVDEQFLLLPDGEKIDATTATRLYHAVQQIVCNWHEFSGSPGDRSTIYDLVDNVVEDSRCLEHDRSKLIIFTYYKRTSRNMLEYLNTKHGDVAVGAYSEVDSAKSVDRFLNDPSCRILVGQPSSCGAGLNPAHLCSEVLFAEASTIPIQMTQAIGRVDRMGQKVRPTVRFALANGTVQRKLFGQLATNSDLVATVENKKSLRDVLLGL